MPGRRTPRKATSKQQRRLNVLVIISGAVLILAALILTPFFKQVLSSQGAYIYPPYLDRPQPRGNAIGDPNAPIVIQEYSDFGCSHCRTFAFTRAGAIAEQYVADGQVYFVFNSVGALLGHPNSVPAAEAAYCAAEQSRFWEYHDLLFANQTALFANLNKNIERALLDFAASLELDLDRFQTCLDQHATLKQVQADQEAAFQTAIVETPSFTINGELFQGDWTQGDLEAAIEDALASHVP